MHVCQGWRVYNVFIAAARSRARVRLRNSVCQAECG